MDGGEARESTQEPAGESPADSRGGQNFGPELVSTAVERSGLHAEDGCWPRKTSATNETTTSLPLTSPTQASKSPSQPNYCDPSALRSSLVGAGVDSEEKRGVSARNPGLVEASQACETPESDDSGTGVRLPAGPPITRNTEALCPVREKAPLTAGKDRQQFEASGSVHSAVAELRDYTHQKDSRLGVPLASPDVIYAEWARMEAIKDAAAFLKWAVIMSAISVAISITAIFVWLLT
jgi:hypothetical protein